MERRSIFTRFNVTYVTTQNVLAITVITLCLLLLAIGQAQAGYWPVNSVSITNISNSPSLDSIHPAGAQNPNGDVTAIWDENGKIYASTDSFGWQPPIRISNTLSVSRRPAVASDSIGLYAVWYDKIGNEEYVVFSKLTYGTVWTTPKIIAESTAFGEDCSLDVDVASGTGICVVWYLNGVLMLSRSTNSGDTWTQPKNISGSDKSLNPAIDIADDGKIHFAYENRKEEVNPDTGDTYYYYEIHYRMSSDNGLSWSAAENLSVSNSRRSYFPDIAVDKNGNVFVVWEETYIISNLPSETEIFVREKTSSWNLPVNLSNKPTLEDRKPAISRSRTGEIRCVWSRWLGDSSSSDRDIYGSIYRNNGPWTSWQNVADTAKQADEPFITENGSANTVLLWEDASWSSGPYYPYEIAAGKTTGSFTLINDGFEGNTLGGTGSLWQVGDDYATGTPAYWDEDRVNWTAHSGSKSAWCAGIGGQSDVNLNYYRYNNYMSAFMKRTIDLTEYGSAQVRYWWRLPSIDNQQGPAHDYGKVNILSNQSLVREVWHNDVSDVWVEKVIDLTEYCGTKVTLDWRWVSDFSLYAEGMYVDDIKVTGNIKEPNDEIAPVAITNLAVSSTGENSAKLTWTAPGDDAGQGTATSYDIRYSTSLITDTNWSGATKVDNEPAPNQAGSSESFTVTRLAPSTKYYYTVKTADESGNRSGLSNVVNATTLTHDATPPGAPGNPVFTSVTQNKIDLSWPAATDNRGVAGYYIERSLDGTNYTFKADVTATSYSDQNLDPETAYYYRVRAYDAVINYGPFSKVAITNTTAEPTTTRYEETAVGSWTGSWYSFENPDPSFSGGFYKRTNGTGKSVTFTFNGTGVTWIGYKATSCGKPKVYIDNVAQQDVDLYGTQAWKVPVYSKTGLSNGTHTIKIEVNGNKNPSASDNYVYIDAFDVTSVTPVDVAPPTGISDLAASPVSTTSVKLNWTAPGDDGLTGTATSYDVKYSNAEITEANWASAPQATGVPAPKVAGSAETFTINSLVSGKYYFAIKTTDDKGNISIISNTAAATLGKQGDANGDGHVNFSDFIILAVNYNTNSTSPTWDSRADFNNDRKIDFSDFIILAVNYESAS